jgi:DNA repair photolyase
MMKHQAISIRNDGGTEVLAQAPLIISASRSTDIPAFYADWFFRRFDRGYVRWRNPFSGQDSYVSFGNTRFIVFWSKNPAPLLPYLPMLKERGIGCYIHFTLNDYEAEGLEPNVPPLAQRIDTFRRLVDTLGSGTVVWRFDPLILTDKINIDTLLEKIAHIANALTGYTEKLVFSFADIESYKKVSHNLRLSGINYREWDEESMQEFALRLSTLNRDNWNFRLATCAERIDLSEYGIEHNRCIDPELISRLTPHDAILQNFLYNAKTDTGQRKACGCILSKDIGAYSTCPHGCLYCYANTSPASAFANYKESIANPLNDSII